MKNLKPKKTDDSAFYVAAYESGAEASALPTWACRHTNPAELSVDYPVQKIRRYDIPSVPGAYHLSQVLTAEECQRLIALTENLSYLEDAAVSLPRDIRHNDNVVWITDEQTDDIIWQRVAKLAEQSLEIFNGCKPLGLNARFRFYRYREGDFFKPHTDGAWPGSRVIDGQLVANAYPDRYSQMTFLIYLNDDYEGGATQFLVSADNTAPARHSDNVKAVDVKTPAGSVLCFPHGMHPLHCVHSSEPITKGVKYIIRTDMLFEY